MSKVDDEDQFDLFTWAALRPAQLDDPEPPPQPATVVRLPVKQPQPTQQPFKPGDVVQVEGCLMIGVVDRFSPAGMVLVNIGIPGNDYPATAKNLTLYIGRVVVWKRRIDPNSRSVFEMVGDRQPEDVKPSWPTAVWYPAGYNPNTRQYE